LKVLVTGGAGFIGSHLVDALVTRGDEVTVLDSLDAQVHGDSARVPTNILSHVRSGAVRFILGDVTDQDALSEALTGIDTLVHLAAAVGVGQSMYQPHHYVKTNAGGTGLVLELLISRRTELRKLVVASSMSAYGEGAYRCLSCGPSSAERRHVEQLLRREWDLKCQRCLQPLEPAPTPESKPADIRSVYAATKKHQEDLCLSFGEAYGIPTCALRFFNVFGPRQALANPYTGVAAIFLSRLMNGNPPMVFEDGRQSRDLVDVRDVVRAVTLALDSDRPGVRAVNVGTGRPVTVLELARLLARKLGSDIEPEALGEFRSGDIRHCYADVTLAREWLGFVAEHRFEDAVDNLIEWCRAANAADRVAASLGELRRYGLVR
jgi:dTDP-L-rhamnose 4-epimerase